MSMILGDADPASLLPPRAKIPLEFIEMKKPDMGTGTLVPSYQYFAAQPTSVDRFYVTHLTAAAIPKSVMDKARVRPL